MRRRSSCCILGIRIICGLDILSTWSLNLSLRVLARRCILGIRLMSLFWRNIFFRPWIKYLFFLRFCLFMIKDMSITDVYNFSFVLGQSFQWYVHLFVRSPISHLKGKDLVVPDFSRQVLWCLNYFGMMHLLKSIFNFISMSICFVLNYP